MTPFSAKLRQTGQNLRKRAIEVLQVNVGKYCNQACTHCHVEAGPGRKEAMTRETVDAVLKFLSASKIPLVDITGGAPELNPNFDYLVESSAGLGRRVMDRCNLTVIFEPGKDYLPKFFRANKVELICSLPCYTEENVDRQRGDGAFELSIRALQRFNEMGYGDPATGLELHLVYNPLGAYLPPPQERLEQDYKKILKERYGLVFNRLYCLANMPITRFEKYLKLRGEYDRYLELLESAFNPATLDRVMCRELISVGWDGLVYDCDFNQMLNLPIMDENRRTIKISALSPDMLRDQSILTGDHCYACAAGAGSSCGGALLSE